MSEFGGGRMASCFWSLGCAVLFCWTVACSRPTESTQNSALPAETQGSPSIELLSRHSTNLPAEVKSAADSVFRLVVHWDTAFDYEKLDYAMSDSYLQQNCGGEAHDFIDTKNCQAVRRCFSGLNATSRDFCYAPYMTGGSTWVVKSGEGRSVLVTNWHVFQRQFAPQMFLAAAVVQRPAAERKELLGQLVPLFSLYDAEGTLVYDSTANSVAPRIVAMGDVWGAAFAHPQVQAVASVIEDYVALEIPLSLGKPLEVSPDLPSEREPAFAVGYPVGTRGRSQTSDGHHLYFSRGHFYSPEQFVQLVEPIAQMFTDSAQPPTPTAAEGLPMTKDYVLPDRGFVYSSCDVVGGNSGGPLLNSRGQIVGMVARSYSNESKYEPAGSVSLFVPHLKL
jgi:hypothetical protein